MESSLLKGTDRISHTLGPREEAVFDRNLGQIWDSQMVLVVKNSLANAGDTKRCGFSPWVGKIP